MNDNNCVQLNKNTRVGVNLCVCAGKLYVMVQPLEWVRELICIMQLIKVKIGACCESIMQRKERKL